MTCQEFGQWMLISAVGGGVAGLMVWLADIVRVEYWKRRHKRRILKFFKDEVKSGKSWDLRNTYRIASSVNLTEDRVRYICSIHKEIKRNEKEKETWQLITESTEINTFSSSK
jgi:hypothetical protein